MNSVVTNVAREKLAKARAGLASLPIITKMAFGDGGVDAEGVPIAPSGTDTTLKNELLRKTIDGYTFPIATTGRYSCTLLESDLIDDNISEIALIDSEDDLIIIKTFTSKNKESDMEMIYQIDDKF